MFKSYLLMSGLLLMGTLVIPVEVNATMVDTPNGLQRAIATDINYSRESETCINLRGCGRRDRT